MSDSPSAGATAAGSSSVGSSSTGAAPRDDSATSGSPASAESTSTTSTTTASSTDEDLLARTRVSQMWVGIIIFAIVLILMLIFVLENTKKVEITYFGFTGHMPLAVAMLLSAVVGILLTAIAGTLRILQLRRRVKKSQAG